MSFENVYRSREGVREINKIADFVLGLVIKNEYEANSAETTESIGEYYKYYSAYTRTDDFSDYDKYDRRKYHDYVKVRMKSLNNRQYADTDIDPLVDYELDYLLKNNKVVIIEDYLNALRISRVYNYDEKNTYYRQFMGLPNTEKDVILLKNFDSDNPEELIAAHLINDKLYPKTYARYILQKSINDIITKFPEQTYLKFINSGLSSFKLRNLPNYSIILYNRSILTPNEMHYFNKAYIKAKSQVLMDYIDGFDTNQPLYNIMMIQNLLYFTIMNYSSSYIEKFTLSDYTDENINDILNSYGYSNLTKISDPSLKNKVVKNLPDLISNKANNYALELILDRIIGSDISYNELKRYYLEKKYTVDDEDMSIKIDTGKSLENSVKLVFRETPAISRSKLSSTSDDYKDYDNFTEEDNLWGGINESDSQKMITAKKDNLKKQILGLNFNSILTRYITLTRTVDILESQRNLRDSLYLMLSYFDMNDSNDFFKQKIVFENTECTPASLFAAMCWLQQMKYYEDPDTIIRDQCLISSSAVFRRFGTSAVDADSFERRYIVNGVVTTSYDITAELLDWNVKDFLKKDDEIETIQLKKVLKMGKIPGDGNKNLDTTTENISDYIIHYRYFANGIQLGEVGQSTTFADLITDYKNQCPGLIKRITNKLRNSHDIREYRAWLFLLDQNIKNNSIYFIFKEHEKFSTYIHSLDSSGLNNWVLSETVSPQIDQDKPDFEKVCNCLIVVTNAFKEWVNTSFSNLVYQYDISDKNDGYVNDMIILFNEFLSAYSELYGVDYKYTLGNKDYDGLSLQLFYNPLNIYMKDHFTDYIDLVHKLKSKISDKYEDKLSIGYVESVCILDKLMDAINGDLEYDEETNKYIINLLLYELTIKIQDKYTDLISIDDVLFSRLGVNLDSENLILEHRLKIIDRSDLENE